MLGLELKINKCVKFFFNNEKSILIIKGPFGYSVLFLPKNLILKKRKKIFVLAINSNQFKELFFTYFSLIRRIILGVCQGFYVFLIIKGIGWHVYWQDSRVLVFNLGFSKLVYYKLPYQIEIILFNKQKLKVFGLNYLKVKQVISFISQLRDFNKYKGKGILQQGSIVKLKSSSKFK